MTRFALIFGEVLHLGFAGIEMFSWPDPCVLSMVVPTWNAEHPTEQVKLEEHVAVKKLLVAVVHNAGIYNVIVFAGFVWGLWPHCCGHRLTPDTVFALRSFFFSAAILAGLFGAATLTLVCLVQAGAGLFGLIALRLDKPKESAPVPAHSCEK